MSVYFIGAGTGDIELITIKGAKILAKADIVLYDALVNDEILNYAKKAKCINVGKRCGRHTLKQVQINQIILEYAQKYECVVRLKGGDPCIFARLQEEIDNLNLHNIDFEIVAGVTSATVAAASLKIPLTKRGISRGVQFRTLANAQNANIELDSKNDTIVFYMGKHQCEQIFWQLKSKNYDMQTNIYLIENISLSSERKLAIKLYELNSQMVQNWLNEIPSAPMLMIVESSTV